jgi:hypothetical protein
MVWVGRGKLTTSYLNAMQYNELILGRYKQQLTTFIYILECWNGAYR